MVFYRKYRPLTIEELDSEQVRVKLSSILTAKELSHAFLFTGPKGLGKTSTARIVAKIVNCENKTRSASIGSAQDRSSGQAGFEPCNKCDQCISTMEGRNFDVLEIDAASNRGIDEIRDLREKIRLAPMKASKKVYIIDEVHMLTAEAFDALLKTLEEPPAHAIFILCTTEPHKVPATIVSRCVHITFNKATDVELVRAFERIAKGEKLNIQPHVLEEIAKMSDGSFRDGTKILEELAIAADKKKITEELLESIYKTSSLVIIIEKLLKALSEKDIKSALSLIGKCSEQGIDIKYFTDQFIEALHKILLFQFKVTSSAPAGGFSAEEIKKLIELVTKYYPQLKYSVIPQLPLEMAVIEYCQGDSSSARLSHAASGAQDDTWGPAAPSSRPTSSLPLRPLRSLDGTPSSRVTPSQDEKSDENNNSRQTSIEQRTGGATSFLQELIEEVKPHNHSIAGVLRGCSAEIDGNKVNITTKYKFHKEKLEEGKTLEVLEKVASALIGKKAQVSVILKEVKF